MFTRLGVAYSRALCHVSCVSAATWRGRFRASVTVPLQAEVAAVEHVLTEDGGPALITAETGRRARTVIEAR